MALSIVSYNVNGLRSAIDKGFAAWLAASAFDVVCVQETKAWPEQVDTQFLTDLGYQQFWHVAEKKGYSGVATFTRRVPDRVVEGCGIPRYDREGRVLRLDFGDWSLLNCYFPSGTTGDERQGFKMEFLVDFAGYIQDLRQERPQLIIVGDYNIAHQEMDIHDPKGNKKSSGFLPEERAWMDEWFAQGFTDAYRFLHPTTVEYSWWSFRAGARANNKGWRIDYQTATSNLAPRLRQSRHLAEAVHSDHCPVWVEWDL